MIDLDFLEIGTSDYNLLSDQYSIDKKGFIVEPLQLYLDKIPDRINVKKFNLAIGVKNYSTKIFYISPDEIRDRDLPYWIRGCNCLDSPHPMHVAFDLLDIVQTQVVQVVTIEKFLKDNFIRKIDYLKIDTEGLDCLILKDLYLYLKNCTINHLPNKIEFESNTLHEEESILEIYKLFSNYGYYLSFRDKENSLLVLNHSVKA